MTTSQRLKISIINALAQSTPDEAIAIVDAKARLAIGLPVLAVDISSVEPHSEALQNVERVSITATLRCHAGDEDDADVDAWIDQIETTLTDVSYMKAVNSDQVHIYSWTYGGSVQNWDESVLEVAFSVECLVTRFVPQEQ